MVMVVGPIVVVALIVVVGLMVMMVVAMVRNGGYDCDDDQDKI